MNKKLFLFLISFLILFNFANADITSPEGEGWSNIYHFEYSDNTLSPDRSMGGKYYKTADELYTPLPEAYTEFYNPENTDFYGIIYNVKGMESARFGFNKPKTVVQVLGKSIFDVKAPFFADSDHVNFYTKTGKLLFTISLKGSSFCNDDKVCNEEVGENYNNCPYDCPKPLTPEVPKPETTSTAEPAVSNIPASTSQISATTGAQTPESTTPSSPITKTQITLIILGVIFLILIIILWKLRGFRDE